jgi:hypothetical protein
VSDRGKSEEKYIGKHFETHTDCRGRRVMADVYGRERQRRGRFFYDDTFEDIYHHHE